MICCLYFLRWLATCCMFLPFPTFGRLTLSYTAQNHQAKGIAWSSNRSLVNLNSHFFAAQILISLASHVSFVKSYAQIFFSRLKLKAPECSNKKSPPFSLLQRRPRTFKDFQPTQQLFPAAWASTSPGPGWPVELRRGLRGL